MINDFINLWFPSYCLSCDVVLVKGEEFICSRCFYDLPVIRDNSDQQNPVAIKFYGKIPVSNAASFLEFSRKGIVQKLLHNLKYAQHPELGEYLGNLHGIQLKKEELMQDVQLIIPVPLHKRKYKQRGYNQSDYYAKGLSSIMQIPYNSKTVVRHVFSKTQTRKSRIERWDNVSNIFKVVHDEIIKNRHVLLVDDVITSGATLEACGKSLLDAGAREISVATIATA